MTPKEYFEQVCELDEAVESKRSERKAIRDTVLGATTWEDNPSFSNQFHSTTESAALKLAEHSDRVNEQVDELVDLKIKIASEIDQLDMHNHRMILRERYLRCKEFSQIVEEQHYSETRIYDFHRDALIAFGKKHSHLFNKCSS